MQVPWALSPLRFPAKWVSVSPHAARHPRAGEGLPSCCSSGDQSRRIKKIPSSCRNLNLLFPLCWYQPPASPPVVMPCGGLCAHMDPWTSQTSSRRKGFSIPGHNFFHTFCPSSSFNCSVLPPSSHPSLQTRLMTMSTTMSTRKQSRSPSSSSSLRRTLTGLRHILATAIPVEVPLRGGQGGEEGVKSQPRACSVSVAGLGCQPALEMPASKG